jgi:hypothetical protein
MPPSRGNNLQPKDRGSFLCDAGRGGSEFSDGIETLVSDLEVGIRAEKGCFAGRKKALCVCTGLSHL